MFRAQQQARLTRTRTQLAKINELISRKWEEYKARPAPARYIPPPQGPSQTRQQYLRGVASARRQYRLLAIRDLMRMELPDRITDVRDGPAVPGLASPAIRSSYLLQYQATWTPQHQSSECLYLILSSMRDGESSALDYFRSDEIGDTDNDGMNEILDAMGQPIYWLRAAPGFSVNVGTDGAWGVAGVDDDGDGTQDNNSEAAWPGTDDNVLSEMQTPNASKSPDFFDHLLTDPRHRDNDQTFDPFGLYPLIYSAGEDKVYGIYQADEEATTPVPLAGPSPNIFRAGLTTIGPLSFPDGSTLPAGTAFPSDPYATPAANPSNNLAQVLGTPSAGSADNFFSQNLEIRGN